MQIWTDGFSSVSPWWSLAYRSWWQPSHGQPYLWPPGCHTFKISPKWIAQSVQSELMMMTTEQYWLVVLTKKNTPNLKLQRSVVIPKRPLSLSNTATHFFLHWPHFVFLYCFGPSFFHKILERNKSMALVPSSKLVLTEGPSGTLYSTPSLLFLSGNKKCKSCQKTVATRGEKRCFRTYLGAAFCFWEVQNWSTDPTK